MTKITILSVNDRPEYDTVIWDGVPDTRLLALVDQLRDSILAKLNADLVCQPQAPTNRSMDFGTRLSA